MRKAKPRATEFEAIKPLPLDTFEVDQSDCFGKLWSPEAVECSMCADCLVCGIVFQQNLKKKVKKVEEEQGPFLDQVKELSISDLATIEKSIKIAQDKGEVLPAVDVINYIMEVMQTKDRILARERFKTVITNNPRLFVKGGNCYYRDLK